MHIPVLLEYEAQAYRKLGRLERAQMLQEASHTSMPSTMLFRKDDDDLRMGSLCRITYMSTVSAI